MTREAIIRILDDHDGTPADETVVFTFEGIQYTTDLSAENAAQFRQDLQPWLEAAWDKTPIGRNNKPVKRKPRTPASTPADRRPARTAETTDPRLRGPHAAGRAIQKLALKDRQLSQQIRKWARSKDLPVGDHGVIPQEIQDAYRREHG